MDRAERTERIKTLGRVALDLARGAGLQGYIEVGGHRFGLFEFRNGKIAIDYLRSDAPHIPSTVTVRHLGAKVLLIGWADRKITKSTFKPGEWETQLLRYKR